MSDVLVVDGLDVTFDRHRVLADLSLRVRAGEILGVIGETGSGKTTLARAVVGAAPVRAGRITFDGTDLTALRGPALRAWRRTGQVQYVFQDPLRALDPQHTVARIVAEGLTVAGVLDRTAIDAKVTAALVQVGLDPALADRLPGQISGGQRQRVLLARAVALDPRLLLCDEPVSALDASNRNHVLRLLADLRDRAGVTVVVISHDLSSLAGIADRVAVLYGGRLVEQGPIERVLSEPRHPYTALLTASAPSVRREHPIPARALRPAPEHTPAAAFGAGACPYAPRCPFATPACVTAPPTTGDAWQVACHHAGAWRAQLAAGAR
ncbi:ABC transporter ATP-binding protein [Dactylosporangium aurantiacum]|uniref:ABC transporter ATP-binding protein n=1 Tax=Dactylosporangium aurantiacum TaxID=35754 RepID=A0A9Q9MF24_9ACTN|nr:ABC transporter ATP-binding protein [Dactylosporangium aurantiacum]MDG6104232.1 ABC transporter ATP-binding protein [Dactylosporangium aurantiacum]UWZ56768.1 ABC transporter ATP-binding protein [Dactylosporangium aurantiacum]